LIFPRLNTKLRTGVIDRPRPGEVVDRFTFPVEGWLWLGTDQDRIAAVEACVGTTAAGETDLLFPRPDVSAALALPRWTPTGFRLVAGFPGGARGMPIELGIRARLEDGSRTDWLSTRAIPTWSQGQSGRPLDVPPADEIRARASATHALPLPPEHLQVRQVGSAWGEAFYREGRVILSEIGEAFADAGKPLSKARSILDFGVGCGRVLAGFADLQVSAELWGCDIDGEAIAWNAANLASLAQFRVNPPLPPAPFETGQFDAVYSVSVFTHLPEEMQFAWLSELRRIVEPGGVVVASIHGGHYYRDAHPEVRAEGAEHGFSYRRGAITHGLPDFYMVAMHSETYIRAKWTRFFELVAYHERLVHGVHDAVVLRRGAD
jgi:SAM-dependent methyltransferase